jgi:hypothetical protein
MNTPSQEFAIREKQKFYFSIQYVLTSQSVPGGSMKDEVTVSISKIILICLSGDNTTYELKISGYQMKKEWFE